MLGGRVPNRRPGPRSGSRYRAGVAAVVFVGVVAIRFVVPLWIPRYPLPAVLAALVVDALDQTLFQVLTDDPLTGYQTYDKALDIYYLAIAYCATMRNWRDPVAFGLARGLFLFRLVGVTLFELLGWRWLLLVFPNTFEYFFVAYEAVATRWNPRRVGAAGAVTMAGAIWVFVKLPQEWWIHVAELDATEFMADHQRAWIVLLAMAVAGSAALATSWRRLPPPDWRFTVDADRRLGPLPGGLREVSLRDPVLIEKALMLSLIAVIFSRVLPGIESGPGWIAAGVAALVVLNAFVSEWWYRRGHSWPNAVSAFLTMLGINAAIVAADAVVVPGGRVRPAPDTLFLVVLLSLLIALYDRFRATRGRGDRRTPVPVAVEQWLLDRRRPEVAEGKA